MVGEKLAFKIFDEYAHQTPKGEGEERGWIVSTYIIT
jgi:hypothetical protein